MLVYRICTNLDLSQKNQKSCAILRETILQVSGWVRTIFVFQVFSANFVEIFVNRVQHYFVRELMIFAFGCFFKKKKKNAFLQYIFVPIFYFWGLARDQSGGNFTNQHTNSLKLQTPYLYEKKSWNSIAVHWKSVQDHLAVFYFWRNDRSNGVIRYLNTDLHSSWSLLEIDFHIFLLFLS